MGCYHENASPWQRYSTDGLVKPLWAKLLWYFIEVILEIKRHIAKRLIRDRPCFIWIKSLTGQLHFLFFQGQCCCWPLKLWLKFNFSRNPCYVYYFSFSFEGWNLQFHIGSERKFLKTFLGQMYLLLEFFSLLRAKH